MKQSVYIFSIPMRALLMAGALMFWLPLTLPSTAFATQPGIETRDALQYFFNQSFNNLPEEVETAREEGKIGIFIMFNDADCPWCQKMKATIMNQAPVQDYYRSHFRLLHMDTKGDTMMTNFDGTEMAEKDFSLKVHRVRATPVFMFFDLDGNVLMRFTGAASNIDEFIWLGEFIVSGEYKNSKFARFKQQRLAEKKTSANL